MDRAYVRTFLALYVAAVVVMLGALVARDRTHVAGIAEPASASSAPSAPDPFAWVNGITPLRPTWSESHQAEPYKYVNLREFDDAANDCASSPGHPGVLRIESPIIGVTGFIEIDYIRSVWPFDPPRERTCTALLRCPWTDHGDWQTRVVSCADVDLLTAQPQWAALSMCMAPVAASP